MMETPDGGAGGGEGGGKRQEEPLALPAFPENGGSAGVLKVGGEATSLEDELGPLVVQEDGSLQRITNWSSMTDAEKERTKRVLTKRNAQRLEALKAAGKNVESQQPQ
uniref:Uncharacterized protein n=1 Tax=Hemiselmis andersenii TaxID=464988 RepID=A0A7S1DM31_HEMAN|mmetsp:Transcript_19860/g.47913  ORF Transcript_19860/g.47913 Transcript_19860/m.47913 type:complete len:108 (+) Transcript_19860:65-388(+)